MTGWLVDCLCQMRGGHRQVSMGYEFEKRDDGVIWVSFSGDIGSEDVATYLESYNKLVASTPKTDTLLFLVDVSNVGKASARARKAFMDAFRNPERRKTRSAIVGASRYIALIADFVIRMIGKEHIRIFDSEGEAVAWLKTGLEQEG